MRDGFTVKLRADAVLDEVDLSAELKRSLARHEERLAQYRQIEARDFPPNQARTRPQTLQYMILKKGMLLEEGSVGWTKDMLAVLAEDQMLLNK